MSTRIDITVVTRSLREFAKQVVANNRRAQLEKEADRRTTAEAQRRRDKKVATEVPWPGAVPEVDTETQLAANRNGNGSEFAIGWLVQTSADVIEVTAGKGAASLPFIVENRAIIDASEAPSPFTTEFTFDPTTERGWNAWTHRATSTELLPSQPVWYRFRPCTEIKLAIMPSVVSYGRDAEAVMPLSRNLIYARSSNRDWYRRDYLLTASTAVDYATADPFADMIWTYEEVAGTSGEDPDTLIATPSRAKAMRINIDAPITVDDEQETNIFYDVYKCYSISDSRVREVSAPLVLRTRLDEIFGMIPTRAVPAPAEVTGVGATTGGPSPLPSLATNVIDGITWTTIGAYSLDSFSGYTQKDPGLSDGRTPELLELLQDTPFTCFGIGDIAPDNAEMGDGSDRIATPFVYRLLNGTPTIVEDDFYDSLETISGCLSGLAPMPSRFYWVSRRPNDELPTNAYLSATQDLTFKTYASSVANASTGGEWYDFGGGGLPSTRGVPSELKIKLAPFANRVLAGLGYEYETRMMMAVPYGDKSDCRSRLLELGFTSADLVP